MMMMRLEMMMVGWRLMKVVVVFLRSSSCWHSLGCRMEWFLGSSS